MLHVSAIEQARSHLEARLSAVHAGPVHLCVTQNRCSLLSYRLHEGRLHVRLHRMFLDAPPEVEVALFAYLMQRDPLASRVLSRFVASQRALLSPSPLRLQTRGRVHDLQTSLDLLNPLYFEEPVEIAITWSRHPPRGRQKKSIKLGSYHFTDKVIRIHPALDQSWVPAYFVHFVVYHEMLHHVIPSSVHGERRRVHPPAFRLREKQYAEYTQAMQWERRWLEKLLRS